MKLHVSKFDSESAKSHIGDNEKLPKLTLGPSPYNHCAVSTCIHTEVHYLPRSKTFTKTNNSMLIRGLTKVPNTVVCIRYINSISGLFQKLTNFIALHYKRLLVALPVLMKVK